MNVLLLNSGYSLESELSVISQLPEVLLQSIASLDAHRRPMDAVHGQLSLNATVLDLADREGDWSENTECSKVFERVAMVLTIFEELLRDFEGRVGTRKCEFLTREVRQERTFILRLIRHLYWLFSVSMGDQSK